MATVTRSSARRPQVESRPAVAVETAPEPVALEPSSPPEPEPTLWTDHLVLWLWLAGAALLGVLHLWHHFVNAMRWWN